MQIQCECGQFRAKLKDFPKNSPGRLMCYCDDCQTYLHYLGRPDVLDPNAGTEIIPTYPSDFKIVAGKDLLKCTRLFDGGMYRFATTCCNTPIANTRAKSAWIGNLTCSFVVNDRSYLEKTFGQIKSRILGKYAKGTPPSGTPKNMNFTAIRTVIPFMLKGALCKKAENHPFFESDGITPIAAANIISPQQRNAIRESLGFAKLT